MKFKIAYKPTEGSQYKNLNGKVLDLRKEISATLASFKYDDKDWVVYISKTVK